MEVVYRRAIWYEFPVAFTQILMASSFRNTRGREWDQRMAEVESNGLIVATVAAILNSTIALHSLGNSVNSLNVLFKILSTNFISLRCVALGIVLIPRIGWL